MKRAVFIMVFAAGSVVASPVHDFGAFGSTGDTLHGQQFLRAVGPLIERTEPGERPGMTAFRPFFTRENDVALGRDTLDVLWPVSHFRWWRGESDWRVLTAFYHDGDVTDPSGAYRFWILPLYAQGRNKAGERYGALFPLGGRIDDWCGRDRVEFILFPLYWHSELNDLRTDHWLWPLVSRTTGDGLSKFRVFPF